MLSMQWRIVKPMYRIAVLNKYLKMFIDSDTCIAPFNFLFLSEILIPLFTVSLSMLRDLCTTPLYRA